MKLILGIVVGIVLYHYFPVELTQFAEQVGSWINTAAEWVAEATR